MTTAEHAPKSHFWHQQMNLWAPTLRRFNHLLRTHFLFHFFFFALLFGESVFFLASLALFKPTFMLAFLMGLLFFTLFFFLCMRIYLQAKKPEHLHELCQRYIQDCTAFLNQHKNSPEMHLALAKSLQKFAGHLHEKEYLYFSPPSFFKQLSATLEKLSCFCFWKDLHLFKELLLRQAVDEHLQVVKLEPTNLEVHAALANAYVMLSSLYSDPRKYHGFDENRWIHPERLSAKMQHQFRQTAKRAIEEFKILNAYAPEDPWVHMQLAYSYHDLQMPEEERKEYETVLKLLPDDKETLFKLGMLYFEDGQNAKGLQIYEILKETHYKKAEHLIKFYGTSE